MIGLFCRLAKDEEGQGMVEYALILAFIALVCFAAYGNIGQAANGKLGPVAVKLQ